MSDLLRRIITSSISLAIVVLLLVFAYNQWLQFAVAGVVAILTAIAIWEYEQFAKAKGGQMIFPALFTFGFLEVLSFFVAAIYPVWNGLPVAVFVIAFIVLFALHFRENDGAVVDMAVSSFGLLYIAVPMGMILGILYSPFAQQDGRWWVIYLLVVTKITDVGAYFGGNLWGRRKLAPNISPGKTIEGALVGLLCAVCGSFIFFLLSEAMETVHFHLDTIEWSVMGLIIGCIGQFGDLSESLLKRDAKKKDSNTLPGLGGVLDSIDSLLFTAPILYFYLYYIR